MLYEVITDVTAAGALEPHTGAATGLVVDCKTNPAQGGDLTLSTIFLTALSNQLLGREFAPQPLPAGEIAELHRMVSRNGRLDPALRQQTTVWLQALTEQGECFGDFALNRWEEEFVITSYSIHYTKLYEQYGARRRRA